MESSPDFSPPKIVLLAVHLAATADITGLTYLASKHSQILRKEILLRILLTYLPETLRSADYVPFLVELESDNPPRDDDGDDGEKPEAHVEFDVPSIEELPDDLAAKKVRKLRLLHLSWPEAPTEIAPDDHLSLFLLRRAYRIDEEAGLLDEVPGLFAPFLDHSAYLRTWLISVVLPLIRRNFAYYPQQPIEQTLAEFERLPDRSAVSLLLSQTGTQEDSPYDVVGRDLRGMVGPWLHNDVRWSGSKRRGSTASSKATASPSAETGGQGGTCPGWDEMLEWLTSHASKPSWKVAVGAIEQWDGPEDADLGEYEGLAWLQEEHQQYMERRYARAALASAYLVPEASVEALNGIHTIVTKIMTLLDEDPCPPLNTAASLLAPMAVLDGASAEILLPKNATHLRTDPLDNANPLTTPSAPAARLLHAASLSAFIMSRAGAPCTARRAAELCLLQNERDQKAEASKLLHAVANNGPKTDDKYWIRARNEIMWLRDWGTEENNETTALPGSGKGVFGQVKKEFIEVEMLKALLNNTRYSLAKSLYEDSTDQPLPRKTMQDTIFACAMSAYDNASNPNRGRGGLKKCDEIIHSFPKTVERALPATQRLEALLRTTQGLSQYRLVLKQGEPFAPVVLRVHKDPVLIVEKVLEQNPKSYTNIQDLIDVGTSMVEAGLTVRDKAEHPALTPEQEPAQRFIAERRITAMCIDAALTEDDFETAYSYVVNRLPAVSPPSAPGPSSQAAADEWSWKAALQAGKYRRTTQTVRPTHLGTGSGNPEIRHLEQRIECLSAALRIAPTATLQEILNAFRRCEEELDVAVRAEAESERAWDDAGDMQAMPGGFSAATSGPAGVSRAAGSFSSAARQQTDEAPLSLFDLSRATARAAQKNLSALSSLKRQPANARDASPAAGSVRSGADHNETSLVSSLASLTSLSMSASSSSQGVDHSDGEPRTRKRDQFREAAVGTLVSGVGWLVGAQPTNPGQERD
ncbi:hypothetical protein GGTG_07959 [Gaeumannomyces tritici R3-111a-1]|uniref:Sec39 domain-containing protein n=1 Tax=Gaeumannomyces tritici (strain R3-111a-1) TaxID=644352 RepID=J3P369_GAET3|nr:hypothetical protein GGTG_07959 [Gaeumannomyces tritici R3-111a-1]EJT74111.1 hypothetical protein GGTG_07959 [Gaeumannomyces tritici R3-111a-1]